MLSFSVCVFSEQVDHTPKKKNGPGDSEFQNASVAVSSELCMQNSFNAAGWENPVS